MIELDGSEFSGLRPRAWICVGAGYSREDVKTRLLVSGNAFTGDAVQTLPGLCQKIAGVDPRRVLASPGRQEVLRMLLSLPGMGGRLPELKRLKRQGAFFRRLDLAIQSGRTAFAHWDEAEVYSAALAQRLGENPLRGEIERLARAYEDWLVGSGFWDPPLLMRRAIEILDRPEGLQAERLALPEKIYLLNARTSESLERSFEEALARRAQVVSLADNPGHFIQPKIAWERWHTLDDAAESLAETLAGRLLTGEGLVETVVLIPDGGAGTVARRALQRALAQQGVPLSDPRDPTRIRWDERVKWAMLPLETVARGFERARVIALVLRSAASPQSAEWVKEIRERGIRHGLGAYAGGKLSGLQTWLGTLQAQLGGKKTVCELGRAHLEYLQRSLNEESLAAPRGEPRGEPSGENGTWILDFLERIWKQMAEDLERVGLGERRAAPLYWVERLGLRISEEQAPVERMRFRSGVDVYRLSQAPLQPRKRVHVLGIPAQWLASEGVGDYWFSEREREILSAEFSVRSGIQAGTEREQALRAWLNAAEDVEFLDARFDPDGRERESIAPVIQAITTERGEIEPVERGSHPRWLASYGAIRPTPPQIVQLAALESLGSAESFPGISGSDISGPVISASALENYSRCGFIALARNRWRLEDPSEPDADLWPQVKGIILHEAVRGLVHARDGEGNFSCTARDALEQAWRAKRPRGLLRSARIEAYVKRKLVGLLETFMEQEREYAKRSGTRVVSLEDVDLKMDYPGFSVVGEPDRIDEHPDGLWVIDYKTSSQAPTGTSMLENGYRLQLPFYALAVRKKFGKEVLGFQFVQLDRKGTRRYGAYFPEHNGKEPGKITRTTNRSKSLLTIPRGEVWARFDEHIQAQGKEYVAGRFEAMPRLPRRSDECGSCAVSDLCGYRRVNQNDGDDEVKEGASEGSGGE